MERPTSLNRCLSIAMLRTLGLNQKDVARITRCADQTVVEVERWLAGEDYKTVARLCDDQSIKKMISFEGLYWGLEPENLSKLERLSGDMILRHYRKGDYFKLVDSRLEGQQSTEMESQRLSGSQLHQIDPLTLKRAEGHQQDMLGLVQRWRDGLGAAFWEHPLRDLDKPGIQSSTDILCYPLELDAGTETAIIRDYLYQHLRSSDYSWLLDDEEKGMNKWKALGGQELAKRRELLKTIDEAAQGTTGLAPPDRWDIVGPTRSFSDIIYAAAVDGLYRGLAYHPPEWNVEVGLYAAKYGAFAIALAATKEDSEQYRKWHEELMVTFEEHNLVQEIIKLKGERESATKAIQDALTKLMVDRFIPGQCEGCPTSGLLPHQQG